MIQAVLFDLDNTLVDFMSMKRAGVTAAVRAMIAIGLPMSEEDAEKCVYEIYREFGIEYQEVFDRMLEQFPSQQPRLLAAAVSAYRDARGHHLQAYAGVRETLVGLIKRGIALGVVSDAPQKQAWLRLIDSGIDVFFDTVVAHEDTGVYKPNPKPFKLAMGRLGVTAAQTIMVGDWPERDIRGADALGVVTVFARYGDQFGTGHSGADYELGNPIELLELVDKLGVPRPYPYHGSGQFEINWRREQS